MQDRFQICIYNSCHFTLRVIFMESSIGQKVLFESESTPSRACLEIYVYNPGIGMAVGEGSENVTAWAN
jgi:hypothetical protein